MNWVQGENYNPLSLHVQSILKMEMLTIDPKETLQKDLHQFILGTVAPRPIAFVGTLDEEGRPNLAPYSFFNAFSSNPPIVVFSSNRRAMVNISIFKIDCVYKERGL